MSTARVTSEGLAHRKNTVMSQEIRADRQKPDILEVGQSADGDVGFELSFTSFETFLANAMRYTLASAAVAVTSGTFAASSFTASAAVNFVAAFEVGQFVRIKGGAQNASAVAEIAALTSTVLTFTGTTLTAGADGTITVEGRTLKNGTTKTSFLMEVDHEDVVAVRYYTGMRVNTMALEISSEEIITGTFSFLGKRGFTASTTVASATASAPTTTPLTSAVNVATLFENGVALTDAVQSLTFNLNNNMRARPKIASKTGAEPGDGSVEITGQINAYFEGKTLYDKLINHTETSIALKMKDSAGNVIVLSIPSVYFSDGTPAGSGIDQDVFAPLDFMARKDPTLGYAVRMDLLPA